MLVFVSDLHLTDGTSGETIKPGAFTAFRERLRDLAYDASWRANGKYKPIDRVDLVLLGDVLDVIRSAQWLAGKVRPWSDWKSQAFKEKVAAISDAILASNHLSLGCLKSLRAPNVITVPDATNEGRPASVAREPDAAGRIPVEVRVHYVVGNHDWFFHLPGAAYTKIRQKIVNAMGLSNPPKEPFPHRPEESAELHEVFQQHQVVARHGDVFDSFNYEGERDASSLGDAIVVELLNRFPSEVRQQMSKWLPQGCLTGLNELDNVRPLLVIPAWIDGLLRRTCPDPKQAKQVKAIWDKLAQQFLQLSFVRARDKWYDFPDLVDTLELALKFSRGISLRSLDRLLSWWDKLSRGGGMPFHQHAFGEQAFKSRAARFMVYGHTHHHEIVPLDSCYTARGIFNQMCINTGTWRRVHERARWKPEEQEFMGYYTMTYVAFFKDDERGGRAFETWSGALGE